MLVKINGIPFNPESVLRFAPRKKGRMKFEPDDICSRESLKAQQEYVEKCGFKTWTVDKMGWRFMLWKDEFGNMFPQCFAPLSGELEMPEQA